MQHDIICREADNVQGTCTHSTYLVKVALLGLNLPSFCRGLQLGHYEMYTKALFSFALRELITFRCRERWSQERQMIPVKR